MLPAHALVLAATDSAAGCMKAALGPTRPRAVAWLPGDDLLGARLAPLDDLPSFVRRRFDGVAALYRGDDDGAGSAAALGSAAREEQAQELAAQDDTWFADAALATTLAVRDQMRPGVPIGVAAGASAADFAFLAYALALHQARLPDLDLESRAFHTLDPGLVGWPDLGSTRPSPAMARPAAWARVDRGTLEAASALWGVLVGADLDGLNAILADPRAHPGLRAAAHAFAAQFPDDRTGLSGLDDAILQRLAAGPLHLGRLLGDLRSARPLGATATLVHILRRVRLLAAGEGALVAAEGPIGFVPPLPTVRITPAGVAVLEGRRSAFDTVDLDYWVGAFHVTAAASLVRRRSLDAAGGTIVRVGPGSSCARGAPV